MTWSKDKPTVPGWYWYRGDYAGISAGVQPVVVYVAYGLHWGETSKSLAVQQPFMDFADSLEQLPGEWAGPIAPPP